MKGVSSTKPAQRMEGLPPYLFLELDRIVERQRKAGHDVINLGIGDPDLPTPDHIVQAMKDALDVTENHRYPNYLGSNAFREAMADWYRTRFGVELDPVEEVVGLIGSKEGIAHLIWAWAGPGDVVLVPDPAYPVYQTVTMLSDATPYPLPLVRENRFLPDLRAIPESVLAKAKMLWLNYPNNPTGAIAPREFLAEAVELCRRWDILLCHDAAYAEMGYDGYRAPSVLEIPGAKEVAVEFYSFSKPFNMTGWRIAAAVGAAPAIVALGQLKSNLDSGPFTAVQDAAIAALRENPQAVFDRMNAIYQARRDLVISRLQAMGIPAEAPAATFYVWFPAPRGMTSAQASAFFVEKANVVVTPGRAYGEHGEGWLRIALTVEEPRLKEALDRMARALAD
ncbi:MAG: LL-diaminopimelate aminotransferase [Firmicutes bacterium]|nr:LL-diaminopimelate aminotransferase [Bacillota bacterium]